MFKILYAFEILILILAIFHLIIEVLHFMKKCNEKIYSLSYILCTVAIFLNLILAIIYAITVNNQNFDMFISLLSGLSSLFLYMEIMQYNFSTMCSIHKLRKKYFLYSGFFCILCVVNVLTLIIN